MAARMSAVECMIVEMGEAQDCWMNWLKVFLQVVDYEKEALSGRTCPKSLRHRSSRNTTMRLEGHGPISRK